MEAFIKIKNRPLYQRDKETGLDFDSHNVCRKNCGWQESFYSHKHILQEPPEPLEQPKPTNRTNSVKKTWSSWAW